MTEELSSVKWRRKVLGITEALCDTVEAEQLLESLPYLHGNGWDEVIEERFVNHNCGYPTCSNQCRPMNQRQLYHIDRKSGKIFENSNQRKKFCSDHCFEKSANVRSQLVDESLWITGENSKRFDKKYILPKDLIVEIKPEKSYAPKKVQIVQQNDLLAKISNLKIKDEESDKEDVNEEEEEFKHVEPYERCSDDEEFVNSIQSFVKVKEAPKKIEKSSPKPLPSAQKQEQVFEKLRSKYGKQAMKKKMPVFIEPQKMILESASKIKNTLKVDWIVDLLKSWISDETRRMVKEGFRPSGGDVEELLMQFLGGGKENKNETVNLPNLDKYNIREKRLNIFMQAVKINWSDLEARLELNASRKDLMARVCATFNFDTENITGWTRQETNIIAIAIFLLLSQIDAELEEEFCRNDQMSGQFFEVSKQMCGDFDFLAILRMIKNEIGNSAC